MKKCFTMLLAFCLLITLSPAALAADMSGMSGGSGQGSNASLNETFARLQRELAQSSKDSAQGSINEVEKLQSEQKALDGYLKQARTLQEQAKESGSYTQMPDAMKRYMDQNHLAYSRAGGDALHDKDEWNVAIQSLETRQEKLAQDIQQQMVSIQNFMGRYNDYTQGNSSANNNSSTATLSSIARGQSLFSSAGMENTDLPPIATSLIVGVILGMAVMWAIERFRKRRSRI